MRLSQPPKDGSLLPGYRVECRSCGEKFMEISRVLRKDDSMTASHFSYLDRPGPFNHEDMACTLCGAVFEDFELEPRKTDPDAPWQGFYVRTVSYGGDR